MHFYQIFLLTKSSSKQSPLIYRCFHFLSEFPDDRRYPAGGGFLCQRSDAGRGDGADEGNVRLQLERDTQSQQWPLTAAVVWSGMHFNRLQCR